MATTETPKAGESLKALEQGLAEGRFTKTGVVTCLSRRLDNTKEGTAKFVRTSKALANAKAGKPLTQNVWPTKPKAKPSKKGQAQGETFTVAEVSDLVQKALASQREEFLAELKSVAAEQAAAAAPSEQEEATEESETPDGPAEGWYIIDGVEVYRMAPGAEHRWVDEGGDAVAITLAQEAKAEPLETVTAE